MGDKTWKKVEREACRELGGDRRGPTGLDTVDCDDRVKVGLEIKSKKKLVWLTKDWEQAVENAEKVGLIPVLYVREGGHKGRRRVQMRVRDLLDLEHLGGARAIGFYPALPGTVRFSWEDFVLLYRAAYNNDKETQTV